MMPFSDLTNYSNSNSSLNDEQTRLREQREREEREKYQETLRELQRLREEAARNAAEERRQIEAAYTLASLSRN